MRRVDRNVGGRQQFLVIRDRRFADSRDDIDEFPGLLQACCGARESAYSPLAAESVAVTRAVVLAAGTVMASIAPAVFCAAARVIVLVVPCVVVVLRVTPSVVADWRAAAIGAAAAGTLGAAAIGAAPVGAAAIGAAAVGDSGVGVDAAAVGDAVPGSLVDATVGRTSSG